MTCGGEAPRSGFEWRRDESLLRFTADFVKYALASAAALTLDYGLLLLGSKTLGLNYLVAAAIGFLSGLLLIYVLSIRYVFGDRRIMRPTGEFLAFFVIGIVGLTLTELLMRLFVEQFGASVELAKIPTAAIVFLFNFTGRRTLLFSKRTADGEDPCVH